MSESTESQGNRRFRVVCPACEWRADATHPKSLVAEAEAERHDERVHDGEEIADVEAVTVITDGGPETTTESIEQPVTATKALFDAVERLDEDDGAPLGEVIEKVAQEFGAHTACDVLMHRLSQGDMYSPSRTSLRLLRDYDDLVVGGEDR